MSSSVCWSVANVRRDVGGAVLSARRAIDCQHRERTQSNADWRNGRPLEGTRTPQQINSSDSAEHQGVSAQYTSFRPALKPAFPTRHDLLTPFEGRRIVAITKPSIAFCFFERGSIPVYCVPFQPSLQHDQLRSIVSQTA